MTARIPIGLPPGTKALRIERVPATYSYGSYGDVSPGHWIIWLHTRDYKYGTYLELRDDGSCNRVTVRADQGDDVAVVKPADH